MSVSGWIGVDLDGTLAEYYGWKGIEHIGPVIGPMKERVMTWLSQGIKVKIFTARVYGDADGQIAKIIQDWLEANGIPRLEVTNVKDFAMMELWDDRAIRVEINTGKII